MLKCINTLLNQLSLILNKAMFAFYCDFLEYRLLRQFQTRKRIRSGWNLMLKPLMVQFSLISNHCVRAGSRSPRHGVMSESMLILGWIRSVFL